MEWVWRQGQGGRDNRRSDKEKLLKKRELLLARWKKSGLLIFEFKGNPEILEVHIFRANEFTGEPIESEEMKPQWFHIDDIHLKNVA